MSGRPDSRAFIEATLPPALDWEPSILEVIGVPLTDRQARTCQRPLEPRQGWANSAADRMPAEIVPIPASWCLPKWYEQQLSDLDDADIEKMVDHFTGLAEEPLPWYKRLWRWVRG